MNTNMRYASLAIVGLGPGDQSLLTPEAHFLLEDCDVICGYESYIQLLSPDLLTRKEIKSSGMMHELERAEWAIEAAKSGKKTAMVCSGDPGIYAMAGLIFEILEKQCISPESFPVHVAAGVPAVCAAAALLGAPLMHDFCCISLSDLLTPWEQIEKRLHAAFSADFVVALYNPRSKKRRNHLEKTIEIALQYQKPSTIVGRVRHAYRTEQSVCIESLDTLQYEEVDMFTLLIIGNSNTRLIASTSQHDPSSWKNGARILTPRGYAQKYRI